MFENRPVGLMLSAPTGKCFEVIIPILKTRKKLKTVEFSWLCQKTDVVGQIPTMNYGETGLLLRTETTGDINWYFKG